MPRSLIFTFTLVAAAAFGAPVNVVPPLLSSLDGPRRVIVEFVGQPGAYDGGRNAGSRSATLARFHRDVESIDRPAASSTAERTPPLRIRHEYTTTFFGAAVEVSGGQLNAIRSLPYVRAVHFDRAVQALSATAAGDALIADAGSRVNSLTLPTRGEGIRVAVIDTGIDYTHPALGGGFGPGYKVAGGYDFVNDDADPFDDNGHGTHVAGIIAADSSSLRGVAPGATLIAFKVLNSGGMGSESDVMAGIEAAADPNGDGDPSDHVNVANLSLGGIGGADDPQSRAVDAAVAAGVIVCVAAGNSGGFAIIGSPGTSRSAITVGAISDSGAMAAFSSRGPSPGELSFKPDVVAPGVEIISTFPGNRMATLSGTSMATPHVAGVCALLASLHPDWPAGSVKMALASTATTIDGTPVERGAGRVDALLASQAVLFAGDSGLSFGLDAVSGGTFNATRTITITNRGSAPQTLSASATATTGAALTITPASATVGPGQTQAFDVHVAADNGKIGFPAAKTLSGNLTFTGSGAALKVPWVIVRSARVTISYHVFSGLSFGYMPRSSAPTFIVPYSDDKSEAYVAPGNVWDFLVAGADPPDSSEPFRPRMLVSSNHPINGDDSIDLGPGDAPYKITLAATDDQGTLLNTLPRIPGRRRHTLILQLIWPGKPNGTFDFIIGATDAFYVSPLPNFRVTAFETYQDVDNARFFNVQHDELQGVSDSMTLSKDVSSYIRSRWNLLPRASTDDTLTACGLILRRGAVDVTPFVSDCLTRVFSSPLTIDSFISPENASDVLFRGLSLTSKAIDISYLRAVNGSTVVSTDSIPGPQALPVENGGETTVGVGPVYPFSILDGLSQQGRGGFAGSLGELRSLNGTVWTLVDGFGTPASGRLPEAPLPAVAVCPGCRIDASTDSLSIAGRPSRGELVVQLTRTKDAIPPTLTSLLLLDADGRIADRLKNGEAATLRFSAADYSSTTTRSPNPAATTVAYRREGAGEWHPLTAAIESSESGIDKTYGRHPAGDLYRVDLAAATAVPNALIDIRIELEDDAGNHLSWTQSPAFMVGDVPIPPRRRAVR